MAIASTKPLSDELLRLGSVLVLALALGIVAAAMTAVGGGWAVAGVSLFIALASIAAGAGLGFLFGVPRVLTKGNQNGEAAAAGVVPTSAAGEQLLATNTNLERISDWLTTMIVGVALTQVYKIADVLSQFGGYLREARIGCHAQPAFLPAGKGAIRPAVEACSSVLPTTGPIIVLLGVICGFLFMYIYTRLVLTGDFRRAESALSAAEQAALDDAEKATAGPTTLPSLASSKGQSSVEDGLRIMRRALYQTDKEGFVQTIALGRGLMEGPAGHRAIFWFYMAAAFGQQHAKAQRDQDAETEQRARADVLAAVQRCIMIDPAYRSRLRALRDSPQGDNDLYSLREDRELAALLDA